MTKSVEKELRKAESHLKAREFSEAEAVYKNILIRFPKNRKAIYGRLKAQAKIPSKLSPSSELPQEHMHELINLYHGRRFEAVLSKTEVMAKLFPNSIGLFNLQGASYAGLEKYDDAIASYKHAIKIDPNYIDAYSNMGIALHHKGSLDAAIEAYNKAIKIDPHHPNTLNNMGISLKDKGEFDKAIARYKQAIGVKPDYADAYSNMGVIFKIKGDFDGAINCFSRAVHLEPDNANFRHSLGRVQQEMGDLSAAMESYQIAIQTKPDQADFYYDLGNALFSSGQKTAAINSYEKALEVEPNHALASHMLASLSGNTTSTAPKEYVEDLFDNYAPRFEDSLVKKLGYEAPKKLAEIVFANHPKNSIGSILDLGCGTGLVGAELRGSCSYLAGVDMSNAMLEEARKKDLYDKLVHADITTYLSREELEFDYFISADVFIYVGDLSNIFQLIKSRNRSRVGTLVFSAEHTEKEGYFLEQSGRYSHSKSYIENLCKKFGYKITYFEKADLREDKGKMLVGGFYQLTF